MTDATEHSVPRLPERPCAPVPFGQQCETLASSRPEIERGNMLLQGLDAAGRAAIEPHLEQTSLVAGDILEEADQRASFLYFPIEGAVSIEAAAGMERIQVALVGREGMVGTSLLLDAMPFNRAVVQFPGSAWRLPAGALAKGLEESRDLHRQLLHGINGFLARLSLMALAYGRGTIEQRLAGWLLAAAERLDTDWLSITHDTLSQVLGARRASVTVALHMLEGKQALRRERSRIRILNNEKLALAAGPYST